MMVVRTRTAVVLPAPFGPSNPNTVPSSTAKLTPSRARTSRFPAKIFLRSCASIASVMAFPFSVSSLHPSSGSAVALNPAIAPARCLGPVSRTGAGRAYLADPGRPVVPAVGHDHLEADCPQTGPVGALHVPSLLCFWIS